MIVLKSLRQNWTFSHCIQVFGTNSEQSAIVFQSFRKNVKGSSQMMILSIEM